MKKFIFCFKFNKVKLKKLKPSREHFIKFILYFLLVCALSFYISKISNKYFFNPDIGLSEKTIQAELIPFPALTICSPFMMKSKYTNYMKYQESFNKGITLNLSVSEQNYLAAKSQSCSLHKWKILENGTKDRNNFNFAKLLEESAPSVDDLFVYCSIKGVKKDCNSLLTRALNDHGMCYSFNMQSFKSIFNEVEISSDFHSFKNNEEKEEIQWSLDKGYNNDKSDVRPFRSLLGVNFGFYMAINDTDMHDLCDSLKRNFRLVYHMPNEMGTFWHENYYFRINSEHSVLMTAKKYTSDSRLRKYSVQKRQCYYEGERKLQFFKAYTKAHCNFECMTNFTLRQCGCMKFSFPRNESTKVCDLNMTKCHMDAYNNWPKFDEMSNTTSTPCNCFPPCSDIRYSMKNSIVDEINVNSNDVIQKVKVMRNYSQQYAILNVRFVDFVITENENFSAYTLENFIADSGGLFGLFLGFSFTAIINYFFKQIRSNKKKKKINFLVQKLKIKSRRKKNSRVNSWTSNVEEPEIIKIIRVWQDQARNRVQTQRAMMNN